MGNTTWNLCFRWSFQFFCWSRCWQLITCCWLLLVELHKLPGNPFLFLDLDLLYLLPEPILHNIKLCKRWYVVLLAEDKRQRKSTAYLQWDLIWERVLGFQSFKHQTAFETCRHAIGIKWQEFEVFSFVTNILTKMCR